MSEQLMSRINELLNQEKWTRATLSNYTIANFSEINEIIDNIFEQKIQDDVIRLCDDHLQHTKNSIIALYVLGIIALSRQAVDDSHMITLVTVFIDNHRWNIVEFLAQRILDFGENKFALRTLTDCYGDDVEKLAVIWERLIRVDYEEADLVRELAKRSEAKGAVEEAVGYYKKAFHRYVNRHAFPQVKEIWTKLIELAPHETEFFYHAESKVAKTFSSDRSVHLLEDLYPYFRSKEDWETAIGLLKRILSYDAKEAWARREIAECYRGLYAHHSQLEEYIRLSNLAQSWRGVHEAIEDFEKHIAFDAGNYVFHRNWGIGRIKEIKDDTITVNFVKKKAHQMSLKMAVSALTILGKDHFWVHRITAKPADLAKKVKDDPVWALKTLIRSFDNAADMKRIKAELVPAVLTAGEWSTWSTKARALLKTDESFGNLPDRPDVYVVREQPISLEEKTYNRFKAEKGFFERTKIVQEFLNYVADLEERSGIDSDLFRDMFDFFIGYLRAPNTVNEQVLAANLLVKSILETYPYLNPGINLDFRELFDQIDDVPATFQRLDNADLRKTFLVQVRKNVREWQDVYFSVLPFHLHHDTIVELSKNGCDDRLVQYFGDVFGAYRDKREQLIWFVRTCENDDWFARVEIPYEKILIAMIHLSDITGREIDNRRDVPLNRKLNKQCLSYLFKDGRLREYVDGADQDAVTRVFTLVQDVKDLDPTLVRDFRLQVLDRFPNIKFYGDAEKEVVSRGGFFTTSKSYEEKQRALQHLLEVDVPANSREIAAAREYGDLKENAEYKAAKERQEILNSNAKKLKEDLERATIVESRDVSLDEVGFGTVVSLVNLMNDQHETFTIMGPWESDPTNAVLSYLSPFGAELWRAKQGAVLQFEINERSYRYQVKEIAAAAF